MSNDRSTAELARIVRKEGRHCMSNGFEFYGLALEDAAERLERQEDEIQRLHDIIGDDQQDAVSR